MKAIVNYDSAPYSVRLDNIDPPQYGKNDVLLKVKAIGVCGSDIHQWQGGVSYPVNYPVVMGHEFAGVIEAVGSEVTDWKKGDRVACETAAYICGTCVYCRTGSYNHCPSRKGFGALYNGAMAEYIAVRQGILHRIPDQLSFKEASLTEPACVAFNACISNGTIVPGDIVVIIGPGPIGAMCLQIAKLQSPFKTIMVGQRRDEKRMEICKQLGADLLVYSDEQDLHKIVTSIGDGIGAHVVVDTVGISSTVDLAVTCTRPRGQVIKIGWDKNTYGHTLDPVVAKGIDLKGTFSHTWDTWERVLRLASVGKIDLESIGVSFPLEEWEQGFSQMDSLEILKAVLELK